MRLAALGYTTFRYTGLTKLARWLRNDGVVLCYHNVVDPSARSDATLGLHIPFAAFERQIRWLTRHYTIVPLDEFVDCVADGASLRRVAAITFDDGYAGVFDNAWPLLRDLGVPATVFLVAGAHGESREQGFWWDDAEVLHGYSPAAERRWLTECKGDRIAILGAGASPPRPAPAWCRPATWEQIAAAVRTGLAIGAHTATHRTLPALSDVEMYRELVESRAVIRRNAGVIPALFAYPYGLWDERSRDAVQVAGYRAAFTLGADRRTRANDLWTLPRLSIPAGISDAAFQAWLAGLNPRLPAPRWRHA